MKEKRLKLAFGCGFHTGFEEHIIAVVQFEIVRGLGGKETRFTVQVYRFGEMKWQSFPIYERKLHLLAICLNRDFL